MAISQQDLTPSNDKVMNEILWRDIIGNSMQDIQAMKAKDITKGGFHLSAKDCDPRKIAYSFIVMEVMDKVGIQQQTQVIKAIAEVQKLIGEVVGDLAKLENLLSELGMLLGNAGGKKYSDADKAKIKAWIENNAPELKKVWNDLFGSNGLMGQLKNALNNPYYKQAVGPGYNSITDLNGAKSPFNTGDWASGGKSFLDFLNGNVDLNNKADLDKLVNSLYTVCTQTYEHNTTSGKGKDDIGTGKTDMETAKQEENGMSTVESTDMSMYSQNLTSEIQIAQQVIQSAAKEVGSMVQNQPGR
jgi:hypothetical protein